MSSLITTEKKLSNPKRACKHFISFVHSKLLCFHRTRRWNNPLSHHSHRNYRHRYYLHGYPSQSQKQQADHQKSVSVYMEPVKVEESHFCIEEDHHHHDLDGGDDGDGDDHDDGVLQLHEVDAKAEDFIAKFKQSLKLERQKSVEEYYAMLARGT